MWWTSFVFILLSLSLTTLQSHLSSQSFFSKIVRQFNKKAIIVSLHPIIAQMASRLLCLPICKRCPLKFLKYFKLLFCINQKPPRSLTYQMSCLRIAQRATPCFQLLKTSYLADKSALSTKSKNHCKTKSYSRTISIRSTRQRLNGRLPDTKPARLLRASTQMRQMQLFLAKIYPKLAP